MKEADLHLYDQLLELSLFQGMSRSDLAQIAGHSKIRFDKHLDGDTIAKAGEPCHDMVFLTNGRAQVVTTAYDNSYMVEEYVSAPYIIEPEQLFGLSQVFASTYTAMEACNIMALSKEEILKLADTHLIFRLNLLNNYTTIIHKKENATWRTAPESMEQRIGQWILAHCKRPAGEKHIKIKMETLAKELNDSRLDVSKALNNMKAEGKIMLTRGMIHVPHAERI